MPTTMSAPVKPFKPVTKKRRKHAAEPAVSRLYKPDDLSLQEWQVRLRRDFGQAQKFKLENAGDELVFSEFRVTNPDSGNTYRVVIRGPRPGDNTCACPDFATNELGTCKHIEFTLAKLASRPGGKAALVAGYQPAYSEMMLRYGSRREVSFRPGRECPRELSVIAAKYFDADGALRPESYARFDEFLTKASGLDHELRLAEDAVSMVAEVRDAAQRRERIEKAFPRGIHSAGLSKLVKAELYDYQKEGALFAARAGRCLIGDEMGLGKTIQAIAAAEIMARHLGAARVLIVCPTSLKHQWEREIERFTNRSACVIGGMSVRRKQLFAEESFFKITNYDTVHADLDLIRGWSPDLVILDEAQRIKNWNTRAARSVKRIASPLAIVLTGTPLENRLEELVSIVQFVDQHRLGPTYRFLAEHQQRDGETGRVVGYKGLDTIGKTLAPILIRRRKAEVLKQLPGRLDKNFFVPMTPEQMAYHEENREIVAKIVMKWRRYKFLSESDQRRLMIALQNMRMSCNSTYLLDQTTDHGVKADELATLVEEVCEQPESKIVVFSQWVRTHELLTRRLKHRGRDHVVFHGGVPGTKRKALIDRFRDDADCRVFLSTDAGGVGLNLQHASTVVNMDLPWNPAVLEQRIGRVHRLGQKFPVRVVNFVSQGTIEEGMLGLLKFKSSLFAGVLDGGQKEVFLGGSRLTRFMETVEKASGAIPVQDAPEPEAAPERATDGSAKDGGSVAGMVEAKPAPSGESARTNAAEPDWSGLLRIGATLLGQLADAARTPAEPRASGGGGGAGGGGSGVTLVRRDAQSGEPYLHLPMPKGEALEQLLGAVGALLGKVRG